MLRIHFNMKRLEKNEVIHIDIGIDLSDMLHEGVI
jgi:hypothetical protein